MSRSKRDKRQIEAKKLRREPTDDPNWLSEANKEKAKTEELNRLNAFQYDEHHEGLWAMLRKRYLKMFKQKKADLTFKEQLKEIE